MVGECAALHQTDLNKLVETDNQGVSRSSSKSLPVGRAAKQRLRRQKRLDSQIVSHSGQRLPVSFPVVAFRSYRNDPKKKY